jgi:CBS domain-containing protein
MKIRDVMTTEVVSVTPRTTYVDAAKLMHEHSLVSLPVCDREGNLIGILSEKDLFKAMYPEYSEYNESPESFADEEYIEDRVDELRSVPIDNFMERRVLSIDESDPILKAGGLMLARHVHRLPVTREGKLIGMVSREQVFSAIIQHRLRL